MTLRQRTVFQMTTAMLPLFGLVSSAQAKANGTSGEGDLIGDPFLNYFALGLLFFVIVVLFYGIIAIHDIPARIAHSRDHPHEDAIHAAGWVSLFTLHALWPFLWIWAMSYQPERGWGMNHAASDKAHEPVRDTLEDLKSRLAALEGKLATSDVAEHDAPSIAPPRKRENVR
jgi:hypothetical protein